MSARSTLRPALALAALLLAGPAALASDQLTTSADYTLTFQSAWNSTNHPVSFPSSAHFSPLIGATHDASASLWEPGGIATPGIESMAETGATSSLTSEINPLIGAGSAGELITGPGLFPINGSVSTSFTASLDHPLVSVVTMIAPSPDWFVGTHGLSLLQDGNWVAELTVELLAYDSGTDAGSNFQSGNSNINPHIPIALISGNFPLDGNFTPFGTFTFTRTDLPQSWTDLGNGLAGSVGMPVLSGSGALVGDGDISWSMTGALANAPMGLVLGLSELNAPFKGGVLVPATDVVLLGLTTDATGGFQLDTIWPAGLGAGATLVTQIWVQDAGGPVGWSASNGICAATF